MKRHWRLVGTPAMNRNARKEARRAFRLVRVAVLPAVGETGLSGRTAELLHLAGDEHGRTEAARKRWWATASHRRRGRWARTYRQEIRVSKAVASGEATAANVARAGWARENGHDPARLTWKQSKAFAAQAPVRE